MTSSMYTSLYQCRNLIKFNNGSGQGVMAKYQDTRPGQVRSVMTPAVAVKVPCFGTIEDAYAWLPPLVVYDRNDGPSGSSFLALARRPRLNTDSSCVSIDVPQCYVKIQREDLIHQVLSSLSQGQYIPTTFDDGTTLFDLAMNCQGQFADNEVVMLAELFLDTNQELPPVGFSKFVSLVQRCQQQGGIQFSGNTVGYMRRSKLLSFVPADKRQESPAPRPKF